VVRGCRWRGWTAECIRGGAGCAGVCCAGVLVGRHSSGIAVGADGMTLTKATSGVSRDLMLGKVPLEKGRWQWEYEFLASYNATAKISNGYFVAGITQDDTTTLDDSCLYFGARGYPRPKTLGWYDTTVRRTLITGTSTSRGVMVGERGGLLLDLDADTLTFF